MIEVNNLTSVKADEEFLKKTAKIILGGESASWRKEEGDLSIALVDQRIMREINKRYRGKDRVTDVLAFPEKEALKKEFRAAPFQKLSGLGEIIICLREVKKNAKRFKSTFEKELATCLIHGILHLLGYGHGKNKAEAKEMKEKQDYYFSQIFQV